MSQTEGNENAGPGKVNATRGSAPAESRERQLLKAAYRLIKEMLPGYSYRFRHNEAKLNETKVIVAKIEKVISE